MLKKPETASEMLCPLARTFGVELQAGCRGPSCSVWREKPPLVTDRGWKNAVKEEAARTGEKSPYAKAARAVADDPAGFGLEVGFGYCGLGGGVF